MHKWLLLYFTKFKSPLLLGKDEGMECSEDPNWTACADTQVRWSEIEWLTTFTSLTQPRNILRVIFLDEDSLDHIGQLIFLNVWDIPEESVNLRLDLILHIVLILNLLQEALTRMLQPHWGLQRAHRRCFLVWLICVEVLLCHFRRRLVIEAIVQIFGSYPFLLWWYVVGV